MRGAVIKGLLLAGALHFRVHWEVSSIMKKVVSSIKLTVIATMLVLLECDPEAELMVKVSADKLSLRVNETVQLAARGE